MAVIVTITGAMPFLGRTMATSPMIMTGMVIGTDPLFDANLEFAKGRKHFLFGGHAAIIFDPHRPT